MAGTFGSCRYCGKQILWIRTAKGKQMPCDPRFIDYWEDDEGSARIVKDNGSVIRCSLTDKGRPADGIGYISHFSTCTNYHKHPGKKARK